MKRTLFLSAALLAAAALAIALPGAAVAAPPSNDDFASATIIDPSALPFSDTQNTSEATTEAAEPQPCYSLSQTDWYAITPSAAGVLRFDASGSDSFDASVNVYRQDGSGFGGLNFMGCGSFSYPVTLNVEAGKTYYVQAGKIYGGGGNVRVNVQLIPPPPNDAFASATSIGSLPYSDSVDATAATIESGEPTPCYGPLLGSIWYAFTPPLSGSYSASSNAYFTTQTSVYSGAGLGSLNAIGCRAYGQPVTFHADAGTTYYIQVGGGGGTGQISFSLVATPNPTASFVFYPSDPSSLDTIQFYDGSYDPGQAGFQSWSWTFGDGASSANQSPTHHYLADGDYTAKLTVMTTDGRTASTQQVVHVRTHDVAIAKLSVPQSASAGQTRSIVVGISNKRYPETVQIQLFRSNPSAYGGYDLVGTLTQSVPVRSGGRTTDFSFSYTFTSADKALGKVTFKAVASLVNARDALPADNEATALPTKVN